MTGALRRLAAAMALATMATATESDPFTYVYDPDHPEDPMDYAAKAVDYWILHPTEVQSYNNVWPGDYCTCLENGYISSWYQNASALYIIDTCTPEEGLVLRTGHLQERRVELLQAAMTCDMLKLMTYCFSNHAVQALEKWKPKCSAVRYTTPNCDVQCSDAGRPAGLAVLAAGVVAAVLGA